MFVTTGIIGMMDSEGELAGLLGHEITHVTHHHIAKQMEQQKKIGLATMAAALLGILAGDPRIASAAISGSMATAQTLALKYSREDEDDADNFGFKNMTKAGFDPKNMVDLLDKLRRWGSFGSEGVPAYMQTHPLTGDRMSHVEDLMHQYESQGPWVRKSSDEFRRFQIIILAKYGDLQRAQNHFQSWSKDAQSLFWVHYGQGWIYIRQGKFEAAVEQLQKALSLRPQDPYLLKDLGQALFFKGDIEPAIQKLSQASILDPKDGDAAFFLDGPTRKKGKSPGPGKLSKGAETRYGGRGPLPLLGYCLWKLERSRAAHYYFGKSFNLKGDKGKALFHFRTALRYAGNDPLQKELIEKEIKTLEPGKTKEKKPDPS